MLDERVIPQRIIGADTPFETLSLLMDIER